MTTCRQARKILDRSVVGEADESELLTLESHLAGCAECRAERARLQLVGSLRDAPEPSLDEAAHARILRRMKLEAAAPKKARWARSPWALLGRPFVLVGIAAAIVAGLSLVRERPEKQPETNSPLVVADRTELSMPAAGSLEYAGSTVRYTAGTRLVVHGGRRTLEVVAGEVDVDVTPGHGRYRVETPKFAVEVLGTRFLVKADSVETVRGLVRVETPSGEALALLHAGEKWEMPAPVVEPVPVAKMPENKPLPNADQLLREARTALAKRDFPLAEETLDAAQRVVRTDAQKAAAAFLEADLLRMQGRPDAAIAAYRRVVARFPGAPVAESGSFFVGELLMEQGRTDEARAALEAYLAAHPSGGFVDEARELLGTPGK